MTFLTPGRVGLVLAHAAVALCADFNAPPPTPRQIESDWLLQDSKRTASPATARPVTPEEDAAGGVDGIRNGQWGFHTEHEQTPWWQVDLIKPGALDRLVLYNRSEFAERNSRITVWVSDDGREFRQVYQHDGTVFRGVADGKPLGVPMKGIKARFIRLGLPGQNYFHLDEVEVYPVGADHNIALGKPATQSSTSQWSVRSPRLGPKPGPRLPMAQLIERGLRLAESQRRLGVEVSGATAELQQCQAEFERLPDTAPVETRREIYFRARWVLRSLALGNPLLDFDTLLFVKRAPGTLPHMSDQHYGWWSRPGGGIYLLEGFKTSQPRVRCLTAGMPVGSFIGPDISWDGQRVVFGYCRHYPHVAGMEKVNKEKLPEDAFYNLYEMNLDGSGRRQLTRGRYDDFDPRYLPNDDILFLSTRKGTPVQCRSAFSESTRASTQPDSYVRCGGDNTRPCAVFTLHAIAPDGTRLRPLSAFENFEWTPSLASDGRILYARWDYIDRFNGHFESLWAANQDGTNPQLVYGNYTVKPQAIFEARPVPGSATLVFTAAAHHSITGGSICLLDRSKGTEGEAPLTRLTPDVCFPETEGWPEHYYANPYPLSEEYFLVGWADQKLPPHAGSAQITDQRNPVNAMGLYLLDAFGNLELLYRDPDISSMYPLPVKSRTRPPLQRSVVEWDGPQEGRMLVQNTYAGLDGLASGSVKALRIVGVPPKVQPHMNSPQLGVSAEDPGKFVLGTVPVEPDGSAHFRLPSGVPVFFQALDRNGLAVQTMRTLTYVQPNQTLSCIGCHESRETAPVPAKPVLAALREPSRLAPGPAGSWPLRFDQLVQPLLDRHCVECHRPDATDPAAARLSLRPEHAYQALITFGSEDLKKLAFERDRSQVGQGTAANSKLWKLVTHPDGHQGVRLDRDSLDRLALWMDTYAHRIGHFSPEQERELLHLRRQMAGLLREVNDP